MLNQIAEKNRHTRDFTLTGLRETLTEVVACFPVYRTYVTQKRARTEDRRYVEKAVTAAKRCNPVADPAIFNFVHGSLLMERNFYNPRSMQDMVAHFAMKFQLYTSPVMAKAQENTVFYRYCRLLSLNEVGGQLYYKQKLLTTSLPILCNFVKSSAVSACSTPFPRSCSS